MVKIALIVLQLFLAVFIYCNHKPGMQWAAALPILILLLSLWAMKVSKV